MTGRRLPFAAGSLVVAAALLQPLPAQAQLGAFIDGLLGRKEQPAPEPEAAPASPPPAAPAPKKPPAQAAKPAKDGKPASAQEKTGSIRNGGKPAETAPKVAAVGVPSAGASEADPSTLVAQANAYFNGITTLTGSFVQIGADGRRIGGKLTLSKPGRLRFDYDQPSPLEVVADGTSVAVRDRKLGTQDLYFISQTPLKFLLREKIDLARDLTVIDAGTDPGGVRIVTEDRSTLGGTSKIQLFFDAEMKTLSQWRITDPQGYQTTVQLSNLQRGRTVESGQFFINYGRAEDKAMQEKLQRP
ncbi:outer membrane lipoprotein carrier protein LolA [uncultured Methylobacterium sp.]|uniref:LolA family protein n=1 Tax=uncultured Methylobacterium sp. TaxID=157278 RepID=UPI0035C971FC